MPKLSIVLDINQHGDQTFRVDGDPSLWPLVGRIAAAVPTPAPVPTVRLTMSGESRFDDLYETQERLAVVARENADLRAKLNEWATEHAKELADMRAQLGDLPWFSDFWTRTRARPVQIGDDLEGYTFVVLDADVSAEVTTSAGSVTRAVAGATPLYAADPAGVPTDDVMAALYALGWNGQGDVRSWAGMMRDRLAVAAQVADLLQPRITRLNARDNDAPPLTLADAVKGLLADQEIAVQFEAELKVVSAGVAPFRELLGFQTASVPEALHIIHRELATLKTAAGDAEALDTQANMVDEVLRPVLTADEGDSILDLASIARSELEAARASELKIRLTIEEAIGRTPDPSRSTEQLAIDLVETLKAAVMRR